MEAHGALAEFGAGQDFGGEIIGNHDAFAGAHLAARMNQSFPGESVGGDRLGEENFDLSGAVLAAAVEAGRQNAGIVQHQAVAGLQVGREIAERAVFPLAGGAIDHQHP